MICEIRTASLVLFILIACASATARAESWSPIPVHLPKGPHPRVFSNPSELSHVRLRSETSPWARAIRDRLLAEAEALVAEPLDIPHEGGQWSHWFTCKDDGTRLNSDSPTRHVCPHCGKAYTGYPYDQVYIAQRHSHWLGAVETLGLAHALDPKPAYVERARAILREYASFYTALPLHDVRNERGSAKARLFAQTLDESVRLCAVCVGCDFLWDDFSKDDRRVIRDRLLLPMVATIRANDRGISNWQSWHNAAVGGVGFLVGDASLVNWAVNGDSGFLFQMRRSLLPGGTWYEASPVYHCYALRAYLYLLEGARHSGMDLYALPAVKRMFDAPLSILLPDGTFPPFNDSDRVSIDTQRTLYEYAYRQFGEARYAALLDPRDSYDALFWGADACAGAKTPPSDAAAVDGVAVLRDPERDTTVCLDYGPGISGHVQPSKLNLVLYAHGDIRLVDPGRVAYGNPLQNEWYRQTVAHNTIVMGCQSQAVTHGDLRLLETRSGIQIARVACGDAYPGVMLERTVLRWDRVVADVFKCRAKDTETFDLPLHFNGALSMLPRTEPLNKPLSQKTGYRKLEDTERIVEPLRYFYVDCGEGNRLFVQVFDASECFVAQGVGPEPTQRLPVLIRRQRSAAATFVTVYQAIKAGHYPSPVECRIGPDPQLTLGGHTVSVGDAVEVR